MVWLGMPFWPRIRHPGDQRLFWPGKAMFNPHLGLQLKGIIDPQEILYGGIARMRALGCFRIRNAHEDNLRPPLLGERGNRNLRVGSVPTTDAS